MEPKILTKDIKLSFDSDTTVKLDENVEITFGVTCDYPYYDFVVKDIRGDAVIKNIRKIYIDGDRYKLGWYEAIKQFSCGNYKSNGFEIQYVIPKKLDYREIIYHLQFSSNLIKVMKLYEFHKRMIILPGYENMPFTYTVIKDREGFGKLCIKNDYGKKCDFIHEVNENDGIELDISFILESSILTEMNQNPVMDESRPESVNSFESPKPCSEMYEIMSNNKYSDVTLISSDNVEIPSHRNLLAKYSPIFDQICDVKEIPLKITVEQSFAFFIYFHYRNLLDWK